MKLFKIILEWVKYQYHYLSYKLFDHGTPRTKLGVKIKRSTAWPRVEKHFRQSNPTCAVCGTSKRLNVHHIIPFHIQPDLELEESNLITLCMSSTMCHLKIGHGGNFKSFNSKVKIDAAYLRHNPKDFKKIATDIEKRREQ